MSASELKSLLASIKEEFDRQEAIAADIIRYRMNDRFRLISHAREEAAHSLKRIQVLAGLLKMQGVTEEEIRRHVYA